MSNTSQAFPRTLRSSVLNASRHFPVVVVTGARQVGKTTLLRDISDSDRQYISLDDPFLLKLAKEDPELFLQNHPAPLLIDEIQYAPELLPFIKIRVDGTKEKGMYWLTGSQPFHLMQGLSESLAGRVGILNLLGFSNLEAHGLGSQALHPFLPERTWADAQQKLWGKRSVKNVQEIFTTIWRGSFPALVIDAEMDRDLFFASYVQTYIQRDVRQLARVGDEQAFLRFIRAAAARTGQLLNMADMARDADIAPNTAKAWLSILEVSGLVYLLQPWHGNLTKRLVKAPKLYFMDTGLCTYLTQWSSPQTLEAGAMSGAIFETWCVVEIIKSYWHNGRRAPLYFFRSRDQQEVDLLIEQDGVLYGVEFKKSTAPGESALAGIKAAANLGLPMGSSGIVCMRQEVLQLAEGVITIPAAVI